MRLFYLIFMFVCSLSIFSSNIEEERIINNYFRQIDSAQTVEEKAEINNKLIEHFKTILNNPLSFSYSFDSITRVGKVYSTDNKIRIYSWNLEHKNSYKFESFIQLSSGEWFRLINREGTFLPQRDRQIDVNNWYGALYYDAIPFKSNGAISYMLIGWGRYKVDTQYKVADILTIEKNGVSLGKPLFQEETRKPLKYRVINEYSWQVNSYMGYEEKKKRLIFDHLGPLKDNDELQYARDARAHENAPDMTFDGFVLKKGIWHFVENIKY